MVKNISLALVSGGSFAVLDGNGNVGEDIFEVIDDMPEEALKILFVGLGDL